MSTATEPEPTASASGKAPDTRGLAGQTVGDTTICAVTQTELIYRGFEIADLAANATFEEVAHLLLVGHKPSAAELKAFKDEIVSMRGVEPWILDVVAQVAKLKPETHPMGILRTGVSLLGHTDPEAEDNSPEAELRKAKRLLAKIPTIIGHGQMSREGKKPVTPDAKLDHAANLMWCMTGNKPADIAAKVYQYRSKSCLTQTELAKLVGTTQSVISRIEDADYEGHSLTILKRIASALGKYIRVEWHDRPVRTESVISDSFPIDWKPSNAWSPEISGIDNPPNVVEPQA